jgi:hypothetical protein
MKNFVCFVSEVYSRAFFFFPLPSYEKKLMYSFDNVGHLKGTLLCRWGTFNYLDPINAII